MRSSPSLAGPIGSVGVGVTASHPASPEPPAAAPTWTVPSASRQVWCAAALTESKVAVVTVCAASLPGAPAAASSTCWSRCACATLIGEKVVASTTWVPASTSKPRTAPSSQPSSYAVPPGAGEVSAPDPPQVCTWATGSLVTA